MLKKIIIELVLTFAFCDVTKSFFQINCFKNSLKALTNFCCFSFLFYQNNANICKRKNSATTEEEDVKKIRNGNYNCIFQLNELLFIKQCTHLKFCFFFSLQIGTDDANETLNNWSPENCSTPKKTECLTPNGQNDTRIEKSLGISLSQSPGTPILKQGNPFEKLPGADKFAQGITEHLPFENLPEAVGKFDKIRGVLSDVQKKLQNIKKNS